MSNPFLPDKTRSVTLTETGMIATVRTITLDEGLDFARISTLPEDQRPAKIKEFLATVITWDATNWETKEPIPVTAENIGLLPLGDGNQLVADVMNFVTPPKKEQKKESAPSA